MKCGPSKEERYEKVKAMSHEERLEYAKKNMQAYYGMLGGGIAMFGGMVGGLWGTIGGGAIGAAFGGSAGLIFGSCGPKRTADETLEWDKELEGGEEKDKSTELVEKAEEP